ncbi:MAG TPA: single-stranded-DNA-specific exonuclease RecJ [Polyangia bacterium]|nr:single-stranded-DNA-specific exonuclease RecJ [Polyangia bacterium]
MQGRPTWTVAAPDPATVDRLAAELEIHSVVSRCLVNRGYRSAKEVRSFLAPRLADLSPPDGMADLPRAALRIADAVARGERIGVFGDYDVDGIASAALVTTFLGEVGAVVHGEIANRFDTGYGLGAEAVDRFFARGCTVLVVLDCGTSDHESIRRAAGLGIDTVVVDHHRIEGEYPPAVAFVNPHRSDCRFEDKTLAAVGLAFYFAAAVRRALEDRGCLEPGGIDLRRLLDLVALGTIADVVPLTGNNRILAAHGLRALSGTERPGLRALMRIGRVRSHRVRADHVAFQLAPRLNAAGRLADARKAYELLVEVQDRQASETAAELDRLTRERRIIEDRVTDEARGIIDRRGLTAHPAIVVAGDGWHRGVLGIVAARLAESSGRPVFVVGFHGDRGIGSARAQGQLDLHRALSAVSGHLLRHGGHREAAGFTVERERFPAFAEALLEHARRHASALTRQPLVCDATLVSRDLTVALLEGIARLGPFGRENSEPVFAVEDLPVLGSRVVGGDHLKLELKTPSGSIGAFGPRKAGLAGSLPPVIRVAASLAADDWGGHEDVELRLAEPPIVGK